MKAAIGLVALFVLGCASTKSVKPPLSTTALVLVRAATEQIQAGEFDRVRESIQRLKSLPPEPSLADNIEMIEQRLVGKELASKIQKNSTLTLEPSTVSWGQTVRVILEIKNPEPQALRIPAPSSGVPLLGGGKEGGLVGRLIEDSFTFDAYGSQVRDRAVRPFSAEGEVLIPPNGSWIQATDLRIPPAEGFAMRVYRIVYEIWPARIEMGEQSVSAESFSVGPGQIRAFPPGYEPLAADPDASLQKALNAEGDAFDNHVLISAFLMPEEKKKKAVRTCMDALSKGADGRKRAVMAALTVLTRMSPALFDEDKWLAWWRSHRQEYEEPQTP